jgi:hypothetical protein
LVEISEFVQGNRTNILATLSFGSTGYWLASKTPQGVRPRDRLLLKTPVVGKVLIQSTLFNLTSAFSALLQSGIPSMEATRQDAVGFSNRFLTYAGEQHLPLNTLEVTEVERNLGEEDFPAVKYYIVGTGPLQPLIASLGPLNNYPTTLVDDIEYFQADEDREVWAMPLNLEVLYHEHEGQG